MKILAGVVLGLLCIAALLPSNNAGCLVGQYGNDSCADCHPGSYNAVENATSCNDCPAGMYAGVSGASSCSRCANGTYTDKTGSTACSSCVNGTYTTTTGSTTCLSSTCSSGYYFNTTQNVCIICPANTTSPFVGATSCLPCPPYSVSEPGSTKCLSICPPGTYSTQTMMGGMNGDMMNGGMMDGGMMGGGMMGGGSSMNGGMMNGPMSPWCAYCMPGRFSNTVGSLMCTDCPSGTFAQQASSVCSNCSVGQFSGNGWSVCSLCAPGSYMNSTGGSNCVSCSVGQYSSDPGATSCAQCPPGKYAAGPGMPQCRQCPPGSFQADNGQLSCQLCPLSAPAAAPGSTSSSSCGMCPEGKQWNLRQCADLPRDARQAVQVDMRLRLDIELYNKDPEGFKDQFKADLSLALRVDKRRFEVVRVYVKTTPMSGFRKVVTFASSSSLNVVFNIVDDPADVVNTPLLLARNLDIAQSNTSSSLYAGKYTSATDQTTAADKVVVVQCGDGQFREDCNTNSPVVPIVLGVVGFIVLLAVVFGIRKYCNKKKEDVMHSDAVQMHS